MPKLFGDNFEDFKRRIDRRPWISLVIIGLVLLAAGGIFQFVDAQTYKRNVEQSYNRAFQDMVDNVRDMEVSLTKGLVCNSPRQLSIIANDIYRKAEAAKANLSMLPLSDTQMDNTSKFLSQVGDYTFSLSEKFINNQRMTDQEYQQMRSLQKYAETLNQNLSNTLNQIYAGKLTIGRIRNIAGSNVDKESFTTSFTNIEKEFANYPALIYDGPFSSNVEKPEAVYLKDKPQLSMEQAREKAKSFLGDKAKLVEYGGESNGKIAAYSFVAYPDPNNKSHYIRIDISKLGGYCIYSLDNRQPTGGGLSVDDCKKRAADFLGAKGFLNMKDSYYESNNNIATINYAYTQDAYIMYPDLIKVKVAMDNGEILGFESSGYLMSHKDRRDIPKPAISVDQARAKVSKNLTILSEQLSLIPTDAGGELYCYEFKCSYDNRHYIVYINTDNGQEEQILLLQESPEGVLSI